MSECDFSGMPIIDGTQSYDNGETRTNLIINYLPQSLTDQEFYKIFVVVGNIKNCRIMKDLKTAKEDSAAGVDNSKTGYSFGFGFVEYHKPVDAARAILQLNNLPVQHKRIKVSYARPPGEDLKETNLYIQNIPRSYTLGELDDMFSPFGMIVQKNLLKDKVTGLPRGVGFVRYDKKSEAELAIERMNGIVPEGGSEPLIVKVAEEHGKMKAAYYAGYHAGLQTNRGGRGGGGQWNRGGQMGRGRGQFNNRGGGIGYSRGEYNNMGKMNNGRGNNHHYNPASGSGGTWEDEYEEDMLQSSVGGGEVGYSNGGAPPPMMRRSGGGGGGGGVSGGYRTGNGNPQYRGGASGPYSDGGVGVPIAQTPYFGRGYRGNSFAGGSPYSSKRYPY